MWDYGCEAQGPTRAKRSCLIKFTFQAPLTSHTRPASLAWWLVAEYSDELRCQTSWVGGAERRVALQQAWCVVRGALDARASPLLRVAGRTIGCPQGQGLARRAAYRAAYIYIYIYIYMRAEQPTVQSSLQSSQAARASCDRSTLAPLWRARGAGQAAWHALGMPVPSHAGPCAALAGSYAGRALAER